MAKQGCGCHKPARYHDYSSMSSSHYGIPCSLVVEGAGTPFADWYSQGCIESEWERFQLPPSNEIKLLPLMRPSNYIGPTDATIPYGLGDALSNKLQAIDVWTPNTEWGGGYVNRNGTYMMIGDQEHAALEYPRYSYAALNTDDLLAEAEDRVASRFEGL